jgi:hypothetical protein
MPKGRSLGVNLRKKIGNTAMPDEVKMIDLPILLTTIKEHLPYEICMLRKTFVELNDRAKIGPQAQRPDELIPNALKESFCIHARSLIDFFVRRSRSTDAIASDFAPGFGHIRRQTTEPAGGLPLL